MKFLSRFSLLAASGVAIASLAGFAGNAQAQSATDITVTVGGILQIVSATPTVTYTNTTLPASGAVAANVNLRSNQSKGFNIKISSPTGGKLQSADTALNPAFITYTVSSVTSNATSGTNLTATDASVFGTSITPTIAGVELFKSKPFKDIKCAASTGCNLGIGLNISPIDLTNVPADDYKDTLTYTIAANN